MRDDDMAQTFKALADPTRRRLLDRLHADNGQTLGALCRDLGITRQGITQHLVVLEAAGLVTTVRRGREKLHYLNPVPLHEIHTRWIAKFERADLDALSTLKHNLEQKESPVEKPKLVHVTYIASTPEQVWNALTDPELTAEYWDHRNVSTWTKGASWEHVNMAGEVRIVGTILEIDPPHRLAHTWAGPAEADIPGRQSRVTFDLEPVGDTVRLTVTHEDLPTDQLEGTTNGWARVLSSLKSLLETGHGLQVDQKQNFTTTFSVDRTPQEAFEAITNVRGWWSQEVEGVTDQVGGEFDYHYKDVHRCTIRVTELVPGRKVAWLVLDNYFNFIEDQAEWKDTEVVFEISEKDGGAEVHFTHVGLVPQYECYDVCSNAWGGYLGGSLRNLINTGEGQPNPKEDGNAPAHQHAATVLRARRSPQVTSLADTESNSA